MPENIIWQTVFPDAVGSSHRRQEVLLPGILLAVAVSDKKALGFCWSSDGFSLGTLAVLGQARPQRMRLWLGILSGLKFFRIEFPPYKWEFKWNSYALGQVNLAKKIKETSHISWNKIRRIFVHFCSPSKPIQWIHSSFGSKQLGGERARWVEF